MIVPNQRVERVIRRWLAQAGPGAHPGCLRLEIRRGYFQQVRVVAGPAGGGPVLIRWGYPLLRTEEV
jgi:hypothetical protein